ncbi:MAG: hypothetical protein ABJQ41_03935 [Marinomonas sp.]
MASALRADLANDDHVLATAVPVVAHMLGDQASALMRDDVIACMRGTLIAIARQLFSFAGFSEDTADLRSLESMFASNGNLVNHCYSLAVEGVINQQLSDEHGIDPALPALLQELIESRDANISQLAMDLLASQTRFVEGQRRGGSAALFELPPEHFDAALSVFKSWILKRGLSCSDKLDLEIRVQYNEGVTRLSMLTRLLIAVGASAEIVTEIETAGLALFISAISKSTGQPRELIALSCQPQQSLRLAVAMKAAGRSSEAVIRQLMIAGADISLPAGFIDLEANEAFALLKTSSLGSQQDQRTVPKNG